MPVHRECTPQARKPYSELPPGAPDAPRDTSAQLCRKIKKNFCIKEQPCLRCSPSKMGRCKVLESSEQTWPLVLVELAALALAGEDGERLSQADLPRALIPLMTPHMQLTSH